MSRSQNIGVCAGITAGFLWGLVFVAPQVLHEFTAYEVTFGRFLFFGLISFVHAPFVYRLIKRLNIKQLVHALLLSATGFWLYTILLVWSVKHSGGVLTTLVIGMLPITISIFGTTFGHLSKRFYLGLGLIIAGLITLNLPAIQNDLPTSQFSFMGMLFLISCLAMWTWYALSNRHFLSTNSDVDMRHFTSFIGILSLLSVSIFSIFTVDFQNLTTHPHFYRYLVWVIAIGIGSTWLSYWLWSICSTICQPSVLGPLIISETLFGLLFTFIYQEHWPSMYEISAIILFVMGVYICITSAPKRELP
jgi:drug/metabolite transporter (DMT)-like permease